VARATLLLVSLVLALALSEWLARALEKPTGFVYERPASGYGYNLTGDGRIYEPYPDRGGFNSVGIRDHEYGLRPAQGARRIVILGDSVMYGPGLDLDRTFDNQLEGLLAAGPLAPIEVINLAVPGYNTEQQAARLRARGLDLQPDLVVVSWTTNDFEATPTLVFTEEGLHYIHHTAQPVPQFAPLPPRLRVWLLDRSALARLASRSIALGLARVRGADEVPALELGQAANSLAMLEIAEMARDADAGVLFVLWPLFDDSQGRAQMDAAAQFLDANGLPHMDLRATFAAEDPALLRVKPQDPMHPSEVACGLAAQAVADRLQRDGLALGADARHRRVALDAAPVDLEDVEDIELRAWLEAPEQAADGDPLAAALDRYRDPEGDAESDAGDLLDFVTTRCGEYICLGFRTAQPLGDHVRLQVRIAPFRQKGIDGHVVVPAGGDALVELPIHQPANVAVVMDRDREVIRLRLPRFPHPACEAGCEMHIGPAETRDERGNQLLDTVDIYYRVTWQE